MLQQVAVVERYRHATHTSAHLCFGVELAFHSGCKSFKAAEHLPLFFFFHLMKLRFSSPTFFFLLFTSFASITICGSTTTTSFALNLNYCYSNWLSFNINNHRCSCSFFSPFFCYCVSAVAQLPRRTNYRKTGAVAAAATNNFRW